MGEAHVRTLTLYSYPSCKWCNSDSTSQITLTHGRMHKKHAIGWEWDLLPSTTKKRTTTSSLKSEEKVHTGLVTTILQVITNTSGLMELAPVMRTGKPVNPTTWETKTALSSTREELGTISTAEPRCASSAERCEIC